MVVFLFVSLIAGSVTYLLISKFQRDWKLAEYYQDALFDHVDYFVEAEDIPDVVAEFAITLFKTATGRFATLFFILALMGFPVLAARTGQRTLNEVVTALDELSADQQQRINDMTFAMIRVLERRSLFFGWLVLTLIISSREPEAEHPLSFGEAVRSVKILIP